MKYLVVTNRGAELEVFNDKAEAQRYADDVPSDGGVFAWVVDVKDDYEVADKYF